MAASIITLGHATTAYKAVNSHITKATSKKCLKNNIQLNHKL